MAVGVCEALRTTEPEFNGGIGDADFLVLFAGGGVGSFKSASSLLILLLILTNPQACFHSTTILPDVSSVLASSASSSKNA